MSLAPDEIRRALALATPEDLMQLADLERQEAALRRARPLAWATLWHREQPRTSQRRAAMLALEPGKFITFCFGGNRAGKTDLGAQWAVAMAMGRDHPDVIEWGQRNMLDIGVIPRGPGVVWSVALTFPDSRRYVRAKLDKYTPAGARKRNWEAENEAEVHLPGGGKIVCKAWAQKREGMQGDSIRALWPDEEPDDQPAWNEALMRLVDQSGRVLCTATPGLRGLSWVYERYSKTPPANVGQIQIFGADNPYIPESMLREILAGFGVHEQAARARGEWVQLEGRIYSAWRRDLHVVPARPLPPEWRRFRAIDFGVRDPFVCLWVAIDPSDDIAHVYRCFYRPNYTTKENGEEIRRLTGEEEISGTVADSAGLDQRRTLARECGVQTLASPKDIREGINAVASRLAPDVEGKPHLVVHDCCAEVIREIEGYRWATTAKEQPVDADNHAMDALRYLCLWLERQRHQGAT